MKLYGFSSVAIHQNISDSSGKLLGFLGDNVIKPVTLSIQNKSIRCTDWRFEINQTFTELTRIVKFNNGVPKPVYTTGTDNSGQPFERLQFVDYNLRRKWAYTAGDYKEIWESVEIQTWDRKELFVDFRFVEKPYKGAPYENLEFELIIFTLAEKDISKFAEYIEAVKNGA